ncbi:ABC transporter substrate-binding protein [Rickettsiaceae bacterium]|nr:ABC transporter substrate-binding protein [Rickettsiaceae bacterium]
MKSSLFIKIVLGFVVFLLPYTVSVARTNNITELESYIDNVLSEGYKIFNDNTLSEYQKIDKTKSFIKKYFYLGWMAKSSLGRNRRSLSKQKIEEFSHVYSNFIIETYSELSSSHDGEKAIIKQVIEIDDSLFIVSTEIVRPGRPRAYKVEYLVHKINSDNGKSSYLLGDVITEGVSMLNSQQAEFGNVIAEEGIDALISDLRKRSLSNEES